jgi:hypothetical protein
VRKTNAASMARPDLLHANGIMTGDIQMHRAQIYRAEVTTVSRITDTIVEDLVSW